MVICTLNFFTAHFNDMVLFGCLVYFLKRLYQFILITFSISFGLIFYIYFNGRHRMPDG